MAKVFATNLWKAYSELLVKNPYRTKMIETSTIFGLSDMTV